MWLVVLASPSVRQLAWLLAAREPDFMKTNFFFASSSKTSLTVVRTSPTPNLPQVKCGCTETGYINAQNFRLWSTDNLHVFVEWVVSSKTRSLICSFLSSCLWSVLFLWDHNGGMVSTNCSGLHCITWNQWNKCMVPVGLIVVFSKLSHYKSFAASTKLWFHTEWFFFFCGAWLQIKYLVRVQPLLPISNDSSQKRLEQSTGRCLKIHF